MTSVASSVEQSTTNISMVANEIKELARQTAQATQEIKIKVKGIQDNTESTSAVELSDFTTKIKTMISSFKIPEFNAPELRKIR